MKRAFSLIMECLLCLLMLSIFAPQVKADSRNLTDIAQLAPVRYIPKLYGIIGNYLVTVDQDTGHATEVGIINATAVHGLAYDRFGDTLYSIANCTTDPELIIVNRTTAEATLVGPVDLAGYDQDFLKLAESIAFNPVDGILYGSAGSSVPFSNLLIRIDPATGIATQIAPITGTIENDGDSMVFINETLYLVDTCYYGGFLSSLLYTVNLGDGVATMIGPIGPFDWHYVHVGLAYNPETQRLFGTEPQRYILVEILPSSGQSTVIGETHAWTDFDSGQLHTIGVAFDIEMFTASISPASSSIVIGDSVTFNSTVSGGTAPYSYQWYLDGTPVSGATSDSWIFTPTSLGNYIVQLNVTDSLTNIAESNVANVAVNAVEPKLVTFSQTGLNPDFTGTVLNVDDISYGVADLPISLSWSPGSSHSFAYQSPLLVSPNAKQYLWTSTNGLTTLQNGSITAATSGNVTGNYKTRFYLAVTSPYDSPSPSSSWFDSGTHITESVTSPVSGGSGVQYVCTGWTGTGSVTVSGSGSNTAFTINQPSSIVWNWKPQYYLTVKTDPVGIATIAGEGWYDQASSVTLTAPVTVNYTFFYWDVDGTSQGNGTNPIMTTMNAPHAATAHYAYVNPLRVNIQPTSATINLGQSVTFTSTVQGGTAPYAYQWYLEGNPVSGATSDGWIFTPSSAGIHYVYLQVRDFNNITAQSETARITVVSSPVGGYSISFDKHTLIEPLAINFALVIGLALFLVTFKRKTTRNGTD